MSSHLRLNATFPVSQGWLLIAGSTVLAISLTHEAYDTPYKPYSMGTTE